MRGHDLDQCCSDKVSHLRPDRRPARSADVGRQFSNVRHLRRPQHTVVFLFVRNSKTYRFSKQAVTDGIHEHGTAEATRAMFRDPSYTSYCPSKEMNGRGEKWFPAFHGVHMHGILERGQRFLLRPHGCRVFCPRLCHARCAATVGVWADRLCSLRPRGILTMPRQNKDDTAGCPG